MPVYPVLLLCPSRGHQPSIGYDILEADVGGGFDRGALIGGTDGLREWNFSYKVLPSAPFSGVNDTSRQEYLWRFFRDRKAGGNSSFLLKCPRDGQYYLAAFPEHKLSYEAFAARFYSSGVKIRQRNERLWQQIRSGVHWYETSTLGQHDAEKIPVLADFLSSKDVKQANAISQPVFDAAERWMLFSGGQSLGVTQLPARNVVTIFCVAFASAVDGGFFELGTGANGTGVSLYVEGGPNLVARAVNTSGTPHFAVKTNHALGTPHLYTVQANAGSNGLKLWVDGVLAAQDNLTGTVAFSNQLVIGSNGGGAGLLTGGVALLGIMAGATSDANRQLIEAAIISAYGLG